MGVSKSAAELAKVKGSSRKKILYISRVVKDWKTLAEKKRKHYVS